MYHRTIHLFARARLEGSTGMDKPVFLVGVVAGLLFTTVAIAEAASNLNLWKSDCCRFVWDSRVVTPAQAAAILGDLQ
jgi:hypothetical protein